MYNFVVIIIQLYIYIYTYIYLADVHISCAGKLHLAATYKTETVIIHIFATCREPTCRDTTSHKHVMHMQNQSTYAKICTRRKWQWSGVNLLLFTSMCVWICPRANSDLRIIVSKGEAMALLCHVWKQKTHTAILRMFL